MAARIAVSRSLSETAQRGPKPQIRPFNLRQNLLKQLLIHGFLPRHTKGCRFVDVRYDLIERAECERSHVTEDQPDVRNHPRVRLLAQMRQYGFLIDPQLEKLCPVV